MADVLVGGLDALDFVARNQPLPALALDECGKLPGQILGILNAGIGAAGAERRHLMRGIADEDHPIMHEAVEPPAIEGVDRDPFQLVGMRRQDLVEARTDPLRVLLGDRVGIGTKLQIDTPDVVGLAVHQRRLAGMERRREPEAALGRNIRRHTHVGDEEFVLEGDAGEVEAEEAANSRARAVGGDQPVGIEPVAAVRRFDRKPRPVVKPIKAHDTVLPAKLKVLDLERAIDQCLFQIELLQIDERRHLVPGLGQKIEGEQKLVAAKHFAELPGDALRHQSFADAQPIQNFQRSLRPADTARAFADAIRIVEQNHRHAAERKIDGGGEPDRPGADHDDGMTDDPTRVLVARAAIIIVVDRFARRVHEGPRRQVNRAARPTSPGHAPRSRSPDAQCPWLHHKRARR